MTTQLLEHAPVAITEGFIHSADGTRISFRRLGSGPAIVFVHGSVSTHTDWTPTARLLSSRYTCFVMDRRGRAHSGVGSSPYSIEREYEDISAVLSAAGPGAMLAGHSYGGVCALGTAMRYPVPKLVLYEPPFPVGGPIAGAPLADYARAIAEGDLDLALQIGLGKFTRLTDQVICAMRVSKAWPHLRALAKSWTRELEAMDSQPSKLDCFHGLACPVLLLRGSESLEHPMQNSIRALAQVLPHARVETLTGQDHMGLRGAPAMVARLIQDFLAE
jgi:pimeloyl-ACP methyl ester carboxylesterase